MITTDDFILSGKYQIVKSLGMGNSSHVYLARHISLKADRAIKVIPKTSRTCLNTISEAQILKSLHHPGIPIIYDIEEDDNYFFLVEEFIQGESLEVFLTHQKFISINLFYTFCRQLCDIFICLHTRLSSPVLYQDLKPEHIIVCGLQIKLIDFGASACVSRSGSNFQHFGNLDFTAPECFQTLQTSVASDIYSLGKIMDFIASFVKEPLSQNIRHIIQKATLSDAKLRFETVEALSMSLKQEFSNKKTSHLVNNIAVVGSSSGCGTTHIAISLVSAMNYLGIESYYEEQNLSDHLRHMIPFVKPGMQSDGSVHYKYFKGFPKYGPGIDFSCSKDTIRVLDFGTDACHPLIQSCDLILLVCSGSLWNRSNVIQQKDILNTYYCPIKLICNLSSIKNARFLSKCTGLTSFLFITDTDAFDVTEEKTNFTMQILNRKGRKSLFFEKLKKRLLL